MNVTASARWTSARLSLHWLRPFGLALACGLALAGAGCRIIAPKHKVDAKVDTKVDAKVDAKVHSEKDIAINSEQIRRRIREQVQPLSGVIVAAADQIMAGTTNRAVRRQALLWKIDAVPALREALFLPNPTTAVFDAWVMAFQMTDYFEKGPGKEGLGDAHVIAVSTCQHLETELARLATSLPLSREVSDTRAFAMKWAADHPMRQSIAGRESIVNRPTEWDVITSLSTTQAVGNLTVTLDDLNRCLEIYSAQLLDQGRWQAELFTLDQTQDLQVDKALPLAERALKSAEQAVATVDRLAPVVERTMVVAEGMPKTLAAERDVTLKAMQAELARAITSVQEEHIAALQHLTSERIAALQNLRDTIVQERKSLTQDLDQISVKAVDHAFWRAAQLCAAVLILVFFGIVMLLPLIRRMFVRL